MMPVVERCHFGDVQIARDARLERVEFLPAAVDNFGMMSSASKWLRGKSRRGVTIVLVVLLLVLLQVATMGALTSAARQADVMVVASQALQARFNAEGQMMRATAEAMRNIDDDANGTIGSIGTGSGTVVTVTTANGQATLTSTVTVGESTRQLRTVWQLPVAQTTGGRPLAEYFRNSDEVSNLAGVAWTSAPAATGELAWCNFANADDWSDPMWRGGPTSSWALRLTGSITIAQAGTYQFATESDDGSDLTINGTQVVNNDGLHAMTVRTGSIALQPGTYPIVARMFENDGDHGMRVLWQPPGARAMTLIPPSVLSGSGPVRGAVVHTVAELSDDANLRTYSGSGTSSGPAIVTNATSGNNNAGVTLKNRARITGNIETGVGSTASQVVRKLSDSVHTGTATALTREAAIARISQPTPLAGSSGVLRLSNQTIASMSAGNYTYSAFTLEHDSVLTINGDVTIVVNGALTMTDRARLVLGSGASVRFFATSAALRHDVRLNNDMNRPRDFMLMLTGSAPTFTMSDRAIGVMTLLNPRGSVTMAHDVVYYGTLESTSLALTDRAALWVDTTALTTGGSPNSPPGGTPSGSGSLVSWSDLTTP